MPKIKDGPPKQYNTKNNTNHQQLKMIKFKKCFFDGDPLKGYLKLF